MFVLNDTSAYDFDLFDIPHYYSTVAITAVNREIRRETMLLHIHSALSFWTNHGFYMIVDGQKPPAVPITLYADANLRHVPADVVFPKLSIWFTFGNGPRLEVLYTKLDLSLDRTGGIVWKPSLPPRTDYTQVELGEFVELIATTFTMINVPLEPRSLGLPGLGKDTIAMLLELLHSF